MPRTLHERVLLVYSIESFGVPRKRYRPEVGMYAAPSHIVPGMSVRLAAKVLSLDPRTDASRPTRLTTMSAKATRSDTGSADAHQKVELSLTGVDIARGHLGGSLGIAHDARLRDPHDHADRVPDTERRPEATRLGQLHGALLKCLRTPAQHREWRGSDGGPRIGRKERLTVRKKRR
jgi:hypothetical protein